MRVQLIFPPQWIPHMPYLSLPALTAYLQERGVDCRQSDLNLESYDRMLSAGFIVRCGEVLSGRIGEIESRDRIEPGLHPAYRELTVAMLHLPLVLDRLAEARDVLCRPDSFYDLERHHWAYRLLGRAFAIISLAHSPSNINFWEFAVGAGHSSIESLRGITANREINPYIDLFEEEFIPRILDERPAILGVSLVSDCQLAPAFTLIHSLRRRAPDQFIVVGGPFFSKLKGLLLEHPELFDEVDAYVIGSGEEPLYRLCRALEGGEGPQAVPGLVYRDDQGVVRETVGQAATRVADLPTPSFDGLPLEKYFSGEPVLPLLSSYGCYWNKCRFCGSFHIYGHGFRRRGSDRVLEDMKTLHRRYGVRHFHFSDEALPPVTAREVAEGIAGEQLPFRWFAEARFETSFDQRLCATMAAGGCVKIKFGLESGSQEILNRMNKGTDLQAARKVIKACHEAGLAMHFFCMVGFPGETEEDFQATRRFFLDLPEVVGSPGFSFYCNVYALDVGSDAARRPGTVGIDEIRPCGRDKLSVMLEFDASSLPSADVLEERRWNLIRTVADIIGTPRTPNEEVHQFLYMAHFDGGPPELERSEPSRTAGGLLSPGATPLPADSLVTRRIVSFQPAGGGDGTTPPDLVPGESVWIMSAADRFTVKPVSSEALEILRLCDGRPWEEIVRIGGSPAAELPANRRRRMAIIEELLASGFLSLPRPPEEQR
jgi:hypothetical protein